MFFVVDKQRYQKKLCKGANWKKRYKPIVHVVLDNGDVLNVTESIVLMYVHLSTVKAN